jgi:hypothetical protein
MVITIAQLVITGIALASNGGSPPQIITHTTSDGELIQVPLVVYVVSLVSSILGWSFLLVASLHSAALLVRLFLLILALACYVAESAIGSAAARSSRTRRIFRWRT